MKTAIVVLLFLSIFPYIFSTIAAHFRRQQLGHIDNKDPRGQYAQLKGPGARAVAAQQNSWEAIATYSAALLAVAASGVEVKYLAEAAIVVLIGRVLHGIFYLTNIDRLRSLSFLVAVAPSFYLFFVAITNM